MLFQLHSLNFYIKKNGSVFFLERGTHLRKQEKGKKNPLDQWLFIWLHGVKKKSFTRGKQGGKIWNNLVLLRWRFSLDKQVKPAGSQSQRKLLWWPTWLLIQSTFKTCIEKSTEWDNKENMTHPQSQVLNSGKLLRKFLFILSVDFTPGVHRLNSNFIHKRMTLWM